MQATIQNEFLTLTVDTFGAEAVSLKNTKGEELLWQAEPSVWKRHAPILFPWTGKLKNGSFMYEGKEYAGGQHGFARDVEHTLVRAQDDTIVLELAANEETKARFPFDFVLTSTFCLEGKTVHHTLTVENRGENAMNFGIGYHPAFNVPFDAAHKTEDYEFRFDKMESPLVLDIVKGTCNFGWKNIKAIPLTDDLFVNDSFCMPNLTSNTIGIVEKDTGRSITCDIKGYPYTLIWSALTEKIRFVCIEPWRSLPAAEADTQDWEQRAAAARLEKGEHYSTTLSTTFDR